MAYAEKRGRRYRGMYRDENGKLRSAGWADGKRAAKALAEEEEAKIRRGSWYDPKSGEIGFSVYFEEHWLPNRLVEKTTVATYRSHYNSELKPAFGHLMVNEITSRLVQDWITTMVRKGVAPRTIEAKFKVLSLCLGGSRGASAIRDKLIEANPCLGVELPTWVSADKVNYELEEVEALMKHVDQWWVPMVILAADTGLRLGELMGLYVSDLVDGVVAVNRTIIELKKSETDNGTRFQTKPWPKSKKRRRVRMSPEIAEYMDTVVRDRHLWPGDRLFAMPARDGVEILRTEEWPNGRPASRAFIRQSVWLEAHELSGVVRAVGAEGEECKRTFHHLRGSHISWLLAGGADVTAVKERAGHAQLSTTNLYVDAMPDSEDRAVEALAAYKARRQAAKGLAPAETMEM